MVSSCANSHHHGTQSVSSTTYTSYPTPYIHSGCSARVFSLPHRRFFFTHSYLFCLLAQVSSSLSFTIFNLFSLSRLFLFSIFFYIHTYIQRHISDGTDCRRTIFAIIILTTPSTNITFYFPSQVANRNPHPDSLTHTLALGSIFFPLFFFSFLSVLVLLYPLLLYSNSEYYYC